MQFITLYLTRKHSLDVQCILSFLDYKVKFGSVGDGDHFLKGHPYIESIVWCCQPSFSFFFFGGGGGGGGGGEKSGVWELKHQLLVTPVHSLKNNLNCMLNNFSKPVSRIPNTLPLKIADKTSASCQVFLAL